MTEEEKEKHLADLSHDMEVKYNNVIDVASCFVDGNMSKWELETAVKDWRHACEVFAQAHHIEVDG